MSLRQKRWLHYTFVLAAIVGSVVSLYALFELGAPRWTTPLNILSVLCIFAALRLRGSAITSDDG